MGAIKRKLIEQQEEQYAPTQLSFELVDEDEKLDDWEQFKQEELAKEKWEENE